MKHVQMMRHDIILVNINVWVEAPKKEIKLRTEFETTTNMWAITMLHTHTHTHTCSRYACEILGFTNYIESLFIIKMGAHGTAMGGTKHIRDPKKKPISVCNHRNCL